MKYLVKFKESCYLLKKKFSADKEYWLEPYQYMELINSDIDYELITTNEVRKMIRINK